MSYEADKNYTPMILAAQLGDLSQVEAVYKTDQTAISVYDVDGLTPLLHAAKNGNFKVAAFLADKIEDASEISRQDSWGFSSLMYTCQHGDLDLFNALYEKDTSTAFSVKSNGGTTPLMLAAQNGHQAIAAVIVEKAPAIITAKDNEGLHALMYAAKGGRLPMVKFLAEKNDIQEKSKDLWSPLMFAATNGHLDVVRFLAEKIGGNSYLCEKEKNGMSPLILAAKAGHLEVVKFLAEKDPTTISVGDKTKKTALMHAATGGHVEVVKFLCELDPKGISAKNQGGWLALMFAAQGGHLSTVKFLCETDEAKTTISAANNGGFTAVMYAAQNCHLETVKYLFAADPKCIFIADKGGSLPLDVARRSKDNDDVIKYLESVTKFDEQP